MPNQRDEILKGLADAVVGMDEDRARELAAEAIAGFLAGDGSSLSKMLPIGD